MFCGLCNKGGPKMDRETRFVPTDIETISCRHCGSTARRIQRGPPPAGVGEMLTFKCDKCDKESKTIIQG
jgi:Zn finger protein HypA/HybF involved in hydrogenase expression